MQIKEISATKLPDIGIKRVAAYARVSSDKEAAIHSLSSQISYYNEYISNHVGWEFAGVYAEMLTLTLIQMHPTCTQTAP